MHLSKFQTVLSLGWGLFLFQAAHADLSRSVLVTGFQAYGRPVNRSEVLAKQFVAELKNDPEFSNIEFVSCILPVDYERAPVEFDLCLKSLKTSPQLILMMGEYADSCQLKLEIQAENRDNNRQIPDAAGRLRRNWVIEPNGAGFLSTTLPLKRIFCDAAAARESHYFQISGSAGNFVCNHLFYLVQDRYAHLGIPMGFIHVPVETRCPGAEHSVVAQSRRLTKTFRSLLKDATPAPITTGTLNWRNARDEWKQAKKNPTQYDACELDYLEKYWRALRG